ncbi:hypothetical protein QJQ45_015196 [Haematococcus lacustris]|nr:hypothetical protein QJQ45_015196 [Haematococcus lacustris]
MPPSMPKQQQDWATARPFSTSQLAALPGEQGPGTPAPLQQGAIHFEVNTPAYSMPSAFMQPLIQPQPQPQHEPSPSPSPSPSPHPSPHASPFPGPHSSPHSSPRHHLSTHRSPRTSPHPSPPGCPCPCPSCSPSPDPCPWHDQNLAWIQVECSQTACACAQCMTPAPRGVCMRQFDQNRNGKHWEDECLTLLCSFAPNSVKHVHLRQEAKRENVQRVLQGSGLYVPANALRADLRFMVLEHLNEQAEWD